jgi:uncharacterized protein
LSGGNNPLDASAVHPESYPLVERILADIQLKVSELIGNQSASNRSVRKNTPRRNPVC